MSLQSMRTVSVCTNRMHTLKEAEEGSKAKSVTQFHVKNGPIKHAICSRLYTTVVNNGTEQLSLENEGRLPLNRGTVYN